MRSLRWLLVPLLALSFLFAPVTARAYTCDTVPIGFVANPTNAVLAHPIWCVPLPNTAPTTRVKDAFGGWLDDFQHNTNFGHFNDFESDYRVLGVLEGPGVSTHWLHANHWMVDFARDNSLPADWTTSMGTAISPNMSFRFQNRQLVMETDVAGGFDAYGGEVWPEMTWSTVPPSQAGVNTVDGLYLYGQFGGGWTEGCRIPASRGLTCAEEADHPLTPAQLAGPCSPAPDTRLIEMSFFQDCGTVHTGFLQDPTDPKPAWRSCGPLDPDINCRDRFRFVWSQAGFVAYVNGVKFAEDSGWPLDRQVPETIVNGSTPVYGYFGEFGAIGSANVFRFHWDRVAVNPHAADGSILPLSAAPGF